MRRAIALSVTLALIVTGTLLSQEARRPDANGIVPDARGEPFGLLRLEAGLPE